MNGVILVLFTSILVVNSSALDRFFFVRSSSGIVAQLSPNTAEAHLQ